jgi:hypothetical protein
MALTGPQRAVLEWLLAYPTVRISWVAPGRPYWTAFWASEEARQHMAGVMRDLAGPEFEEPRPRTAGASGGTPRLVSGTFHALARRGLIRMTHYRPPDGVFAGDAHYQISQEGIRSIRPLAAEPDQRCTLRGGTRRLRDVNVGGGRSLPMCSRCRRHGLET